MKASYLPRLVATVLALWAVVPASAQTKAAIPARTAQANGAPVRIDPAFWWVDMKNPKLQLLVHATGIGTKRSVSIDPTSPKTAPYSGATIESVQSF